MNRKSRTINLMEYTTIGLGNHGYVFAEELSTLGCEVVSADVSSSRVDGLKNKIATAFVIDAVDEQALSVLPLNSVNMAIVVIGESFDASIHVVTLLKQKKVKHIYARAIDAIYRSVLDAFRLERILIPKGDAARGLVHLLEFDMDIEVFRVDINCHIMKFTVLGRLVGYSMNELRLDKEFGLKLPALKRAETLKDCLDISLTGHGVVNGLSDDDLMQAGDRLMCYGQYRDFRKFWKAL